MGLQEIPAAKLPGSPPSTGAERRITSVPRSELARRWQLVRAYLKEHQIDALVVMSSENDLGGYTRWLTDAPTAYRRVVVIHSDDEISVIEHGGAGQRRRLNGDEPNYPGVTELITVSEFPTVHYTQEYGARELVGLLRARAVKHLALAGGASMPYGFRQALTIGLPGTQFHDATDFIDLCKAIKSDEELRCVRASAQLQDRIFAEMLSQVRVGMRDHELAALGVFLARQYGGDYGVVLCGSAPAGEPAFLRPSAEQGRVIQAGDCVSILVENGSPWGTYCELGRNISIGTPSAKLQRAFDQAQAAQQYTFSLCRPGARCADIFAAHNAYMRDRGLAPEMRLYSHGQGYDLVERPLLRDDEPMQLQVGMCLSVHPAVVDQSVFAFVCDNILIEPAGATRIHQTESKLFSV